MPCQGAFPGGSLVKNPPANTGDVGFRKIPWRWKWRLTPEFLPGKSRVQRSLVGYSWWVTKNWTQLRDQVCHVRRLSKFVQFPNPYSFYYNRLSCIFLSHLSPVKLGTVCAPPLTFDCVAKIVNCVLRILSSWSVISSCDMLQSPGFPSQEIEKVDVLLLLPVCTVVFALLHFHFLSNFSV